MSNNRPTTAALATMFGALSNPHRLALFERLCTCCTPGTACAVDEATKMCVSDLGAGLDIAASTLSHHLKTLKTAGLVSTQRRGQRVECWVDPETLTQLAQFFEAPLRVDCAPTESGDDHDQ
jgi:DNA-binding transcriptional ArsR family regulator